LDYMANETLKRVVCRPALYKDTADVMELTSTIWDGEDYVPRAWEDWLADPQGLLAVAEFGGKVVGLVKLTLIDDQEWWMEGLRVHPEFEGRRFASRLHDYLMDYWQRHGSGVLRLATASNRLPVHHLCDRTGFQRIAELTIFVASAQPDLIQGDFTPVTTDQIGEVLMTIESSSLFSLQSGLMNLGWMWVRPTEKQLLPSIEQGKAWWWRDGQGLILLTEDSVGQGEDIPIIQIMACELDLLAECLVDYRRLAASLGYHRAGWVAPLQTPVLGTLAQAGFQRDWELAMYIYEKWL
jgi:GNAT superfamily N-acetyltransferase